MPSTASGELYEIAELDPRTNAPHPQGCVKWGIVKNDRTSEKRLLEHQTGNPRKLVLVKKYFTKEVQVCESLVHIMCARDRTSGEWFQGGGKQKTTVERILREMETFGDVRASSRELQNEQSNGRTMYMNDTSLKLVTQLSELHSLIQRCKEGLRSAKAELVKENHQSVRHIQVVKKVWDEDYIKENIVKETSTRKYRRCKLKHLNVTKEIKWPTHTDPYMRWCWYARKTAWYEFLYDNRMSALKSLCGVHDALLNDQHEVVFEWKSYDKTYTSSNRDELTKSMTPLSTTTSTRTDINSERWTWGT